ncbi:hypothetical protein Ahy_B08g090698 [Arachis hypogaea]|uniref:Protein FAR1-RELATED SEQUENCE n=1 Tax=Arachis hypogaea TaxID=3818 RepID=A0A444Y0H1_ARAHY|nr:hypothetical protein Ahy_B08g090698 [Arachis hypogaea]
MSHVVWNLFTRDAFDKNWNNFLMKYGVGGSKWLLGNPVYLDHHFWTGMKSTQRSKNMHAFFNKIITCNSSLIQFVKQYDNCRGSREQREREFDAADFHTNIPCVTKSSIEAQFQHVYTHEKFKKVNCITRSTQSALGFTEYKVVEQVSNSTFNKFVVTYDAISCKNASAYCLSQGDEPLLEPRSNRFDDLVFCSHNICELASEFEELTGILHCTFDNVMAEMQEYQEKSKGKCSLSHEDVTLNDVNNLQSPPRVRTRGHPKNKLGSNMEKKDSKASKKKKKPALSELNLLDGGSMIQLSSSLYHAQDMNYLGEDMTHYDRSFDI